MDWNAYIATGASAASTWNTNLACDPNFATWTETAGSQENLPINCVNWYEAYAFCIWDGGFLPSEAEWEYVAAGGSQQLEYPWGSTDPGTGNQYAIYNCDYPNGSGYGTCTGVGNIAPVGTATLGAGIWGQLDMEGEVSEWNLDLDNDLAEDRPYNGPCTDCADLTTYCGLPIGYGPNECPDYNFRVIQGGDFSDDASFLLPPDRGAIEPTGRDQGAGFRCARAP
jgi:formylglycine-generating enzyme required for sulfatase activity